MNKGGEISYVYAEDIDDYTVPFLLSSYQPEQGVWEFFKLLRKLPLTNDQILILVCKFGLDMQVQQIVERMNWTSPSSYYFRYRKALEIVQKYTEDFR